MSISIHKSDQSNYILDNCDSIDAALQIAVFDVRIWIAKLIFVVGFV